MPCACYIVAQVFLSFLVQLFKVYKYVYIPAIAIHVHGTHAPNIQRHNEHFETNCNISTLNIQRTYNQIAINFSLGS